jgi:UDP-3-O-[3-hydroxymyristoyl] glucosamine N-acyltransferase
LTAFQRPDKVTLGDLAELVGGRVSGDPSVLIAGFAPLDSAGPGQVTFLASLKHQSKLVGSKAAAIIVHSSLDGVIDRPLLLTDNPYLAFAKVLTHLHVPPAQLLGVLAGASVHPEAMVADDVTISPGCVVEAGTTIARGTVLHPNVVVYRGATIGEDCLLYANSVVREDCCLGNRVILQPGAVIGSDGFGFAPDGERYYKIPQIGRVIIEDDVEIGACTTIDRGTLDDTRIQSGTKIDNLVQVAHNVQIGEDTIIVSQVGFAGSSKIGRHCTFGGQAAVAGHVTVGDNVTIAGRGGVTKDVESNQMLSGLPVMPHREWLKATMAMTNLPEMRKELKALKKQLAALEARFTEDAD